MNKGNSTKFIDYSGKYGIQNKRSKTQRKKGSNKTTKNFYTPLIVSQNIPRNNKNWNKSKIFLYDSWKKYIAGWNYSNEKLTNITDKKGKWEKQYKEYG